MSRSAIFSDALSVLSKIASPTSRLDREISPILIGYEGLKKAGVEVSFQWVPAHVGVKGNEIADVLAKAGGKVQGVTE